MEGLLQSGFVREDKGRPLVVTLLLKKKGQTHAVNVEGCSLPLYWRCPVGWTQLHAKVFADTVLAQEEAEEWEGVQEVTVETRRTMLGYVPDPETGDPVQARYFRFEMRDLVGRRKLARAIRTQSYVQEVAKHDLFEHFGYDQKEEPRLSRSALMNDNYRFSAYTLFQIKYHLLPSRWVRVERFRVPAIRRTRHCDTEVCAHIADVSPLDRDATARLRVCFFDIETYSPDGSFPRASVPSNVVFNIGARVVLMDADEPGFEDRPGNLLEKNLVLCLGKTEASPSCEIRWFENEAELIGEFGRVVAGCDMVVSFNGKGFDWPYLNNRAVAFRYFSQQPYLNERSVVWRWKKVCGLSKSYKALCTRASATFDALEEEKDEKRQHALREELRSIYLKAAAIADPDGSRGLNRDWLAGRFAAAEEAKPLPNPPDELYIFSQYRTPAQVQEAFRYFSRCRYDEWVEPFFKMGRRTDKAFDRVYATDKDETDPRRRGVRIALVIDLDLLRRFKEKEKMESYKLEFISQTILGRGKLDMDYQEMFDMFARGDPSELRTIAEYCAMDCQLLEDLMNAKQILSEMIQLSRAAKTMLGQTVGGQQVLCWNELLYNAYNEMNMIPNVRHRDKKSYVGAVVLPPSRGFYPGSVAPKSTEEEKEWCGPVMVLDFASLYPSIMRAYNIDYSTIIERRHWDLALRLEKEGKLELIRTRTGGEDHLFARHLRPGTPDAEPIPARLGLLPYCQKFWKQMRDSIRADQKKLKKKGPEPGKEKQHSVMLQNYEGQQLGKKLLMNSAYGLSGAKVGYLPDWRVASSITYMGRQMIMQTKEASESLTMEQLREYAAGQPKLRGPIGDLPPHIRLKQRVVYGDTDSVFVKVHCDTLSLPRPAIWAIGEAVADRITDVTFRREPEVILEMEKFYQGFLLIKKKKYVGWVFKAPDPAKKGSHGGKGTLVVRRDTIPFVKTVYNEIRDTIFAKGLNRQQISETTHATVRSLLDRMCQNKMDPSELTLKKRINKPIDAYANPPPHVMVAAKLRQRHAEGGTEVYGVAVPEVGDYVSSVQCMPDPSLTRRQRKALRKGDLAEHPEYWSHHRDEVLLDINFYLERLRLGLAELVEHFIDPCEFVAMVQQAQASFLRKWQKQSSIEEWASNAGVKALRDSTIRSLARAEHLKRKTAASSGKKKAKQTTLHLFFNR